MYNWNEIQDCHGESNIQQEEDSFHQQVEPEFKEETSKVSHLDHSIAWCWNMDTSESRSEIPRKFWNVALKK